MMGKSPALIMLTHFTMFPRLHLPPTFLILFLLAAGALAACTRTASGGPTLAPALPGERAIPNEVPVSVIPLAGPIDNARAEISSMGWFSDTLILMPQYPSRFGSGDGAVFAIPQATLVAFLQGKNTQAIQPIEIPVHTPGMQTIAGFEGFEALTFVGEQAFLTLETSPGAMLGYLVKGKMAPDLSQLTIDLSQRTPIEPQSGIGNLSDEALLLAGERVVTFYEANGAGVNAHPVAHLFDFALNPQGSLPLPNLEYRLTDATPLDENGCFWVINYFYAGDKQLAPDIDPLAEMYGEGATHAQSTTVERLVEFQFTENGLTRTQTPPIGLQLASAARNWEGIVRLEVTGLPEGFLIVTDTHPETLLAYVQRP